MSAPLAGRGIVITRPREQAAGLADAIRRAGGRAILFPTLEILDVEDAAPLNDVIGRLDTLDLAIFVSPIAARRALDAIERRRALPAKLQVAAVGRGSARVLTERGYRSVIAPTVQYDSESLLALPELANVTGKKVAIFRGDGGRELLAETLRNRGAQVEYVPCYRRRRPAGDARSLLDAWQRSEVDAVVVTSSEGLVNLWAMLGAEGQPRLVRTPLVVLHARIARAARELGVQVVIDAAGGDEDVVEALAEYWQDAR